MALVVNFGNLGGLFFDTMLGAYVKLPQGGDIAHYATGVHLPLDPLPSQLWESQFSPPPTPQCCNKFGKCPSEVVAHPPPPTF